MHRVKIIFGKEQVNKYLTGDNLSAEDLTLNVKNYEFDTAEEKNAFIKGIRASVGWSECHIEIVRLSNFQTQVIQAQINLLWHIRETHENDLTVDQVSWIDDDITYVDLKYLKEHDGSSRAEEYEMEGQKTISFLSALDMLTVRLHNTIKYLGEIIDPHQT